ncbi:MAG: hypothetical protein WC517_02160, partial [Patescibacteria group bacterium]
LIKDSLEAAGYDTFLPQRDGFLFADLVERIKNRAFYSVAEAERIASKLIFQLDVYQVCVVCDATVLNLNGRVPDEGAVSEAALCFRSERPLVIYKEDVRSLIAGKDNPLVVGLADYEVVAAIEKIPAALAQLANQDVSAYTQVMSKAAKLFGPSVFQGGGFDQTDIDRLIRLCE